MAHPAHRFIICPRGHATTGTTHSCLLEWGWKQSASLYTAMHIWKTRQTTFSHSHTHAHRRCLCSSTHTREQELSNNKISDYIRKFCDRKMFSGFCLMAISEQETKMTLEIIIVWGILSGKLIFGWKTLPELDSPLPTEACWQNQNGPASDCRDWCLELCQVTIWFLAWAWKRWRVTHLRTARALFASKAAAAENGRCEPFCKHHRVSVNSGNFTFYIIFLCWLNLCETALNIVFCGGNSHKQSARSVIE